MANKYIDAEKLKKRIEKLDMESCISEELAGFYYGIDSVLKVIDSLQQEQPEEDLEKEIKDWCKENVTGVNPIYTADSLIYSLLPKTARHFYELGLNARKEEDEK